MANKYSPGDTAFIVESDRNNSSDKILWHFRVGDAREKLISLYPVIIPAE